jgi:hypothetical protein
MWCFWLPKSVVADSNTIQMPTQKLHVWAGNAGVGVSQLAAETIVSWRDKGGLTTQRIDSEVRERISEIAHSMGVIYHQGPSPDQ